VPLRRDMYSTSKLYDLCSPALLLLLAAKVLNNDYVNRRCCLRGKCNQERPVTILGSSHPARLCSRASPGISATRMASKINRLAFRR
jgi:hypothetical protein